VQEEYGAACQDLDHDMCDRGSGEEDWEKKEEEKKVEEYRCEEEAEGKYEDVVSGIYPSLSVGSQ
jgi:hypothetical protein